MGESQGHREAERPGLGALEKEKLGDGEKGGGRKKGESRGRREEAEERWSEGPGGREGGRMEGVGRGRGRNLQ